MTSLKMSLALVAAVATVGVGANAQDADKTTAKHSPQPAPSVEPPTPQPNDPPPPPPAVRPDPPVAPSQGQPQQKAAPAGQWVYTSQYGWVWMPTGDGFTHLPPDGSPPDMYVYYPEAGWCWVVAPWLWGWGPRPYFGLLGPQYFGWFGVGLGRWYGFEGPYASWGISGRAYWGGGRWIGVDRSYDGPWHGGGYRGGRGSSRSLRPGWRR